MSQQLHTTQTPDAAPASKYPFDLKNILTTLLTAALMGYASSWWTSQKAQGDMTHRIERVEEKAETNAKNILQNSSVGQQNAIRMAEMGIVQNNFIDQIKDLKQEQNEIRLMLNRK